MTTASEGVAVIATQLAHTDRRALSEAWYSALHLARNVATPPRASAKLSTPSLPSRTEHATQSRTLSSEPDAPPPLSSRARAAGRAVEGRATIDRRRPSTEVTKRIERAVAALGVRRPLPAAHTVDVAGGRVRLLVHNDGRATRIVALCSPLLRDQVERALARARFTLAAGGIAVGAP